MAISRWRIALTGAATIALAVVGVGLVQGAQERSAVDSGSALFEEHKERQDQHKNRGHHRGHFKGGFGRLNAVVHGEITVDLPEEGLTTYALDGGTLSAVDAAAGTISIHEATGETVTVHTNDETRVRKDHDRQGLDALAVGDHVVVVSIEENGSFVARRVIVRDLEAESDAQPFGHDDEEEASESPTEEPSPTELEASASPS